MTGKETIKTSEEATSYIKDLDIFVCVKSVDDFPAVLVLGRLCETLIRGKQEGNHLSSKKGPHLPVDPKTMSWSSQEPGRRQPRAKRRRLLARVVITVCGWILDDPLPSTQLDVTTSTQENLPQALRLRTSANVQAPCVDSLS